MRKFLARALGSAVVMLCATHAYAIVWCMPQPLLPFQQWYQVCLSALQQNYYEGGGGMTWPQFVQGGYNGYVYVLTHGSLPGVGGGGGFAGRGGGLMQCSPGAMQCFNHWLRTCQVMPNGSGSWWITGAQQC